MNDQEIKHLFPTHYRQDISSIHKIYWKCPSSISNFTNSFEEFFASS